MAILLKYQRGNKLKRQFLKAYPGLKDIHGRNIKIKSDTGFTQGFGGIEFFGSGQEQVDYRTDEEWEKDIARDKIVKNPNKKGGIGILYNPEGPKAAGAGDVFLDLYSHGISSGVDKDEKLAELYKKFHDETVKQKREDIEWFYQKEIEKGNSGDGLEGFTKNWVDGDLRTWAALKHKPQDWGYKEGRKYLSPEQIRIATEIEEYLTKKK